MEEDSSRLVQQSSGGFCTASWQRAFTPLDLMPCLVMGHCLCNRTLCSGKNSRRRVSRDRVLGSPSTIKLLGFADDLPSARADDLESWTLTDVTRVGHGGMRNKVSDIASVAAHRLGDNALLRSNVSQKSRLLDLGKKPRGFEDGSHTRRAG